jgi:phosphomannomutase
VSHKLAEIFKAYDIRGLYPSQINDTVIRRIAEAYAATCKPKKIAVGRDVRQSGQELKNALITTLLDCGVDVLDIGVIATDQLYYTIGQFSLDGGISVTASHNPGEYNGMKFAEAGGKPINSATLDAIKDWAGSANISHKGSKGKATTQEFMQGYIEHVLSYIKPGDIKPLHIVANANFGAVGRSIDMLAKHLPIALERLNWQEDGSFPKGPPNPLLPENRGETIAAIKKAKPDLGVSWDADADRVFFFTGKGEFVPSCYIIALLATEFLKEQPGAKIVHDVTLRWVIDGAVLAAGGQPVLNRVGHTFIKNRMRKEDSPFSAESSGHYYFKKSYYADNGLVPLLMILEIVSKTGQSLEELVAPMKNHFFMIDETNFNVNNPTEAIEKIEGELGKYGDIDKSDGVSIESKDWRINLRPSNTEPLIRLNAEARNQSALDKIVRQITDLINT